MRNGDQKQMRPRTIQGLVLAAGIAATAWKLRALTGSGAAAATVVGTAVHASMGAQGSIAVVSYFASASALGRLLKQRQPEQQRGNRRDAVQVLANGGPPAAFSLMYACAGTPSSLLLASAFFGSVAAATADTWATEIGTRYGGEPRSIATGRRTAAGESGSVSLVGLGASIVASAAIAAVAHYGAGNRNARAVACAAGGVAGSIADSLVGALIQEQRWCERCNVRTEAPIHICGSRTRHLSGVRAVNNDIANVMGVVAGGLTAAALSASLPNLTGRNGSRVEFATTSASSRMSGTPGAP